MRLALDEAMRAGRLNEVPVGAVITDKDGNILSNSHNLRESTQNPLAHAEILAIEEASKKIGSWRLTETTIYVTLEPCVMCIGAIVNSRIKRVVFATRDPKAGAIVSSYGIGIDKRLNHKVELTEGVLEQEASGLLREFFKARRT